MRALEAARLDHELRDEQGVRPRGQPSPWFESLSIVMPMWNEQDNIRRSVGAAMEECDVLIADRIIGAYDIVVVDDASTDDTGAIADELAARHANVQVIHHPINRKLGGSLKTGFSAARGEVVLYTDADLPCDFAELRAGLRLLRLYEADIVSAYRGSRTAEGMHRTIYSFCYNWLVRLLFGLRVRDVNFAFKLFRRRLLDHVHLKSEGSFIGAELLVRAQRLGYRIVQHVVDYVPRLRGVSTLARPGVIVRLVLELLGLRGELRRLKPLAVPPHPRHDSAEDGILRAGRP